MFEVADTIKLPPFPTREEIAGYCNQGIDRKHPVTVETVRGWERRKFIKPHPGMRWPVRYDAREVVGFINRKFRNQF